MIKAFIWMRSSTEYVEIHIEYDHCGLWKVRYSQSECILLNSTTTGLMPRSYPLQGKDVWWILTQSYHQGRYCNQIAALSKLCHCFLQEYTGACTNHNTGLRLLWDLLNCPSFFPDQSKYRFVLLIWLNSWLCLQNQEKCLYSPDSISLAEGGVWESD